MSGEEKARDPKKPALTIQFGEINEANLEQFRILNRAILPVRYHETFYQNILKFPKSIAKFAYLGGVVVGAIACRIEKDGEDGPKGKPALLATGNIGGTKVYVMTLGVLPAYRGRGIGAKLVQDVLDAVQNPETEDLQGHELEKIYLHMHTVNTGAQKFYKRFGFEIVDELKGYYKRIDPPDCYILEKKVEMKEVKEAEAEAGKEGEEGGEGAAAAVGGDADKKE